MKIEYYYNKDIKKYVIYITYDDGRTKTFFSPMCIVQRIYKDFEQDIQDVNDDL
jgi:hypothetical protein